MTKAPRKPRIAEELRRRKGRQDALGNDLFVSLDPEGTPAVKVLVAFTHAQLRKIDAARGERSRQEIVRDLVERMPS